MLLGKYALGYGAFGFVEPADDASVAVTLPTVPAGTIPLYLVELSPYDRDTAAVVTKRFATGFYATRSTETPANALFRQCVIEALNYQRELRTLSMARTALPSYGQVRLAMDHADMDDLVTGAFSWDDRVIEVRIGSGNFPYADFTRVFRGRISEMKAGFEQILISIQDPASSLRKQAQTLTYAGTGGIEGTEALRGRLLPLCFGYVRSIDPVLVDPANLLYRVHSHAISDANIFVGGLAWTKVTGTPTAGQFRVNASDGTITLGGSSPPTLPVTADVWGDARLSGYVEGATAVLDRILRTVASYVDADMDTISLGSYQSGIYIRDGATIEEIVDAFVQGLNGWWGFTREGKFTARALAGIGSPNRVYREHEILPGMQISAAPPPVWKYRVGYSRTWRVHSDTEIAGAVASADRLRLKNEDSAVSIERPAVRTQSPLARELFIPAIVATAVDAATIQAQAESWYGVPRRVWRVPVSGRAHEVDVGDSVRINHPRFGMSGGADFFVDGVIEKSGSSITELSLVI